MASHFVPSLVVALLNLGVIIGLPAWAADEEVKLIAGIGPTGKFVRLHRGFKFTEGPAADKEGNVYFSDIPNERIHKVDKDGKLSIFREKSNRANGL
jgi:gluconolactonase